MFIVPSFSKDGVKGYEKVTLQWIAALNTNYSIHVVNIGGRANTSSYDTDLDVTIHECLTNKLSQIFYACYALMFQKPLQTTFLFSKKHANYITYLQRKYSIETNIYVTIRTHQYNGYSAVPNNIMLAVDSMTLNFSGKYKKSKPAYKFIFFVEYILLRLYEKKILAKYDDVIFVSQRDAQTYSNIFAKVIPLSTVVPAVKIKPVNSRIRILFTGNMSYEPNRTAVAWFYKEIFSKFTFDYDQFEFVVCGRFADQWKFMRSGIMIKVKSDVLSIFDEIYESDIYIAPMQSGSGMQFKIIEAMACGKPVITSTLGLGSIECKGNQKDIIIADTPEDFFSAIKALSENETLRKQIGAEARQTIMDNYGEKSVGRKIEDFLDGI